MRMSLLLRLLLAAAGVLLAEAKISLNVTSDNTVDTLGMKERERTIAGVEASLLSLLGFTRRPRPQGSAVHIPESLRKLYLHQKKIGIADIAKPGFHTRSANTVRSFSHVESELDEKFQSPNNFRLSFDVSGMPLDEKLQAAELSLSRVLSSSEAWKENKVGSDEEEEEGRKKDGVLRILVHDIVRPGIRGKRKPLLRLIDSKTVKQQSNMTISLDVHPAVVRWLDERDNNHGLLIQISESEKSSNGSRRRRRSSGSSSSSSRQREKHVRLRRSLEESNEAWSSTRPTLFTYTDDGKRKMATANEIIERRARRATLRKNRRKDGREICRRHALYVDFADVGWNDWIVAPPGYDAFYCHGDCPFPLSDHLNSTNHAIVQNLVYSTNPSMVPKACCVPTALSSISMLYLDEENKVVLKNYQDMAVLGCGCR